MGSPLRCLVQPGSGSILSLLWWAPWALLHVYHLPESGANGKINPWITDWIQYVPRLGLQQFLVALSNSINNLSICCFESLGHKIIIMQQECCFLVCYILYKSDWTILYPCEFYVSNSQGQKTDWKCYQCSELVCQDHSVLKTIKTMCVNCNNHWHRQMSFTFPF